MRIGIVLLLLSSCRTTDKPVAEEPLDTAGLAGIDGDGDGFAAEDDCNDDDATVSPAGVEVCDGVDNDCDASVDEDVTMQGFADADGDGFGDAGQPTEVCDLPAGVVANGNDCDDASASIWPGAPEQCDDLDNDCDGSVDEDVTDTWYADADEDGYGASDASVAACEQPAGYVGVGGDCDDSEADAYPGGVEVCDEADNDCDGTVDEGVTTTYYADIDGDGYGVEDMTAESCDRPTGYAPLGGDCDDADSRYHPAALEVDCADPEDYNCDGSVAYADADADGWAACEECDDGDKAVNPAASEVCNGIDDDCDGGTDDADGSVDLSTGDTFYADDDGDGYGDAGETLAACDEPAGHVSNDDDCDDGASAVHPAASEVCNGIDDDCDALVDDADGSLDASTGSVSYTDGDGDGYGNGSLKAQTCVVPAGNTATSGDCNDGAAAINPAAAEVCDDTDNDCDALTDDADSDIADDATWYIDYDADGYGSSAYTAESCDQPSGYVPSASDCDDSLSAVYPGANEVCNDRDDDCDGGIDDADGGLDTSTASAWYLDSDSDGWGAGSSILRCDKPTGYSSSASDCNNSKGTVYPGAPETCNGVDDDCDSSGDEGLTCTYKLVTSDLSSGLCVDDDLYVDLSGTRIYNDTSWGAQCGHVVTFNATPGQIVTMWAVDSIGSCRSMSDVYIVNVGGGVGKHMANGYSNTCGHSASTAAFWATGFAVPGTF